MRVFTVPAEYLDEFEAGVTRLAREFNLDAWRRANGHKPILHDVFRDPKAKGRHAFVVIGQFDDKLALGVAIARGKVATNVPRTRSRKRA